LDGYRAGHARFHTSSGRARSPKADGDDPYSFLLDLTTQHVVGYRGPATSWFDEVRVPLEDLLHNIAEQRHREELRRHREEAQRQRRVAHEERMREQQEAAAARRSAARRSAAQPAWPLLPDGHYDRSGKPTPAPAPRRPITDEARIRYVGRLPHVVFHSNALNSPFFREVPVENRCEALRHVLDVLLRAPSKGTVVIGNDVITVTGKRVTMTLTPDCAAVLTLNPPKPGSRNEPPLYRAKNWVKDRERKQASRREQ